METSMIKIYGSPNCIWCLKAKQLCESMELKHDYILVDDIGFDEFSKKFPGMKTVPQIMWDEVHIGGYQEFAVKVNEYITKESEESDND